MRLGVWGEKMNSAQIERFIDECVDMGLVDFDHADIYGNYTAEGEFGEVMKRRPDLKTKIRHTTKCGIKLISENRPDNKVHSYDTSAKHIRWSVENSLKELDIEQIYLLLIHRPDVLMDPAEVAEEFTKLNQEGKVANFGVSNFNVSQFNLLNAYYPLVNNQIEISPLHVDAFDDGALDQCLIHNCVPTAWSPLGGGTLFAAKKTEREEAVYKVLSELATKYEVTEDMIALAWLNNHPSGIIPVLGTTKVDRVKSALKAKDLMLSRQDWYMVLEASKGHPVA